MKIGALAKATKTKVETVRNYEKFGLLPPPARTTSNYRDYGSDHLARLDDIASRHLAEIDQKIDDLTTLRSELDRLIGACQHGTVGECKIIETLAPRI